MGNGRVARVVPWSPRPQASFFSEVCSMGPPVLVGSHCSGFTFWIPGNSTSLEVLPHSCSLRLPLGRNSVQILKATQALSP